MKKQSKTSERTIKAFIDTFYELYKTKPIYKIKVRELARLAGYNRCTFYAYFSNIYELLEYIETEFINHLKINVFEDIKHINTSEKYISLAESVFKEYEKNIGVLFSNPYSSNFYKRLKSELIPVLMEKYKVYRNNKKLKYMLEYHLSGSIALAAKWIANERDISLQQIGNLIRGLLNEDILKRSRDSADQLNQSA